jgi:hypothetical protein
MNAIRIGERTTIKKTLTPFLLVLLVLLFATVGHAATITVNTNLHETGSGADCSLYEAINAANLNSAFGGCPAGQASPVVDTIAFNITGGGTVKTIAPTSALPSIIEAVFIDGTTQAGGTCTTTGGLTLEINAAASGANTFTITASGSGTTIKGLVINRGPGTAVVILSNSNNNLIACNYIGTDVTGLIDLGSAGAGVQINGGSNNTIGGASAGERNVIAGNGADGITILGDAVTGDGNKVLGNYIGVDAAGTGVMANGGSGVVLSGARNTMIGDDIAGAGNVISGSPQYGIILGSNGVNATINTTIENNIVGLNAAGTAPVPNSNPGINTVLAVNTRIGGSTALARNIISGNASPGIRVTNQTTGITIEGNYIGTDITGMLDLGNTQQGILVFGAAQGVVIGGASANQRNVISGNNQSGVDIQTGASTIVQGNYIGVTADGAAALGNIGHGVHIADVTAALIGGTAPGEGNRISANGDDGIVLELGSGVRILGNEIYGNADEGIDLGLQGTGHDGPSANDAGDTDTGPNGLQNYPVLTAARFGASTQIVGSLNSTASRNFRIEFFSSPAADPSGFGEGQVYLGAISVTTNGSGNAAFNTLLPAATSMGHVVTATATDTVTNNTSEFSQARLLTQPTSAGVTVGGRVIDPNGRGIGKATVILTDNQGNTMRALSNPFGYYSFSDIPAGETVFVSATAKGYVFVPRAVVVLDELTNVDLIGIQME